MSRLESIPLEISYHIFSFLANRVPLPRNAPLRPNFPKLCPKRIHSNNPYVVLSQVSRTLYHRVDAYSAHLLRVINSRDPAQEAPSAPHLEAFIRVACQTRCVYCLCAGESGKARWKTCDRCISEYMTDTISETSAVDSILLQRRQLRRWCTPLLSLDTRSRLRCKLYIAAEVFALARRLLVPGPALWLEAERAYGDCESDLRILLKFLADTPSKENKVMCKISVVIVQIRRQILFLDDLKRACVEAGTDENSAEEKWLRDEPAEAAMW